MLARLASSLDGGEFRCCVLSLAGPGPVGETLTRHGVDVRWVDVRIPRTILGELRRFRAIVRGFRPHLIQGWMYHGNVGAVLASRMLSPRPPVVWGIRQGLMGRSTERLATRLAIKVSARLSRFVAASVYASRESIPEHHQIGFNEPQVLAIANGYDLGYLCPRPEQGMRLRQSLAIPADGIVIGHLARFDPVKNHAGLLRAAALVARAVPSCWFVLAGPGVDQDNQELVALVNRSGLQRQVVLLGARDDIPELMSSFDIFCLSSVSEGFPNALAEASACGIPSVTTDVGEARTILGDAGYVVSPDDVNAFAAALIHLATVSPNVRREIGNRARERIGQQFSLDEMLRQYGQLYRRLAGRVQETGGQVDSAQ